MSNSRASSVIEYERDACSSSSAAVRAARAREEGMRRRIIGKSPRRIAAVDVNVKHRAGA